MAGMRRLITCKETKDIKAASIQQTVYKLRSVVSRFVSLKHSISITRLGPLVRSLDSYKASHSPVTRFQRRLLPRSACT